jgi:hypothetical protein
MLRKMYGTYKYQVPVLYDKTKGFRLTYYLSYSKQVTVSLKANWTGSSVFWKDEFTTLASEFFIVTLLSCWISLIGRSCPSFDVVIYSGKMRQVWRGKMLRMWYRARPTASPHPSTSLHFLDPRHSRSQGRIVRANQPKVTFRDGKKILE